MRKSTALIGGGRWGKNLARNLFELGVLHTICDTSQPLLNHFHSLYPETHVTTSVSELLENDAIDRVMIAAPASLHYNLAKACLLTGKDVFVEKPLCLDYQEGEELVQIAKNLGKVLMVGHLLHYHPCVQRLQQMVKNGELGELYYISSHRLNLGDIRPEENALWNFAPHDISVILSLCGDPIEIHSTGGAYISKHIEDISLTTLVFENDVKAHIYVSWLNPFKEQKLVVIGSTGMAVFDDTKPWEDKLIVYPDYLQRDEGSYPKTKVCESRRIQVLQKEPLKEECIHFMDCCDRRLTPVTDGVEGLRVLRVLESASLQVLAR